MSDKWAWGSDDPRGLLHYNRGCELARLGREREALEDLRVAIAIKASFGRDALKDDYFRGLRSSPNFKAAVTGTKAGINTAKADLLAEDGPIDELVDAFDHAGAKQYTGALDDLGDLQRATIKNAEAAKKRAGLAALRAVVLKGLTRSERLIRKHVEAPAPLFEMLRELYVDIADSFGANALAAQIQKHPFRPNQGSKLPVPARKTVRAIEVPTKLDLDVGDHVIVGHHGLGKIEKRTKRGPLVGWSVAFPSGVRLVVDFDSPLLRTPIDEATAAAFIAQLSNVEGSRKDLSAKALSEIASLLSKATSPPGELVRQLARVYRIAVPAAFGARKILESLETIVVGELAHVTGKPFKALANDLRKIHALPAR